MKIELKNVGKKYQEIEVLTNINLTFEAGKNYSILGKNGAGKSTLFNLILDLIKPSSGEILLDEKTYIKRPTEVKSKLGYAAHLETLIEQLNAQQFLEVIAKIYEIPKEISRARIADLIDYFFPEDRESLVKSIQHYSTGMQKKIAICAAVLHLPDVLILDEPFSGLDPWAGNRLIDFLKDYLKPHRTIIISSHNLEYIEKLQGEIILIHEKTIHYQGNISELTEDGKHGIDEYLIEILGGEEHKKLDWI
jgi:ABC-2 type transport system ATP-binding protein